MRTALAFALATSLLILTGCEARKAYLDTRGFASNSDLVRNYIIHTPEVLAITGPNPVIDQESGNHFASQVPLLSAIASHAREDHNFRLTGPDGVAYVSYQLDKRNSGPWRLKEARAIDAKVFDSIQIPLIPEEDHAAVERLLTTELATHPDVAKFLAGRSIREYRVCYPKYANTSRYPDSDRGKLQIIDEESDLRPASSKTPAHAYWFMGGLVLDDGMMYCFAGPLQRKSGVLALPKTLTVDPKGVSEALLEGSNWLPVAGSGGG